MLDEKFISGVLKLQKYVSFRGLRPLDPDQGFGLDPLGEGLTEPPNPQLLNCNDRAEPGNFREVIISSGMWEF